MTKTANVQQAASGNVTDTLVETRANHVTVEALNFLDERSKVLQTRSFQQQRLFYVSKV